MSDRIGWGVTKVSYSLDQLKWIASMLFVNGDRLSSVLELIGSPSCGFPGDIPTTFADAADWARRIEKVRDCCHGAVAFDPVWDSEIVRAYKKVP